MAQSTVFVIGAGASKEAKLPTGEELKRNISQLLDIRYDYQQISGDHIIAQALSIFAKGIDGGRGNINPYLHEAWHISEVLPQAISIDNFIDQHRNNDKIALCGKLAIVRAILDAEKKSLLYFENNGPNSNIDFSPLEKTWYSSFFQLLIESCSVEDLGERFDAITFIVFNYDRCLEHFIFHSLQKFYRISGDDAANLVQRIRFFHPYGHVGNLPWTKKEEPVEFGETPSAQKLLDISSQIKTFTEGVNPESSEITEIQTHICMGDRVVFLGFAFHKLNMSLLTPKPMESNDFRKTKCFATTLNQSDSDKEVIEEQIISLYNQSASVRMSNLYCNAFFREYWRSLSF